MNYEEGLKYMASEDYITAIECFTEAIHEAGEDIESRELANRELARCYFRLEKYDRASKKFSLLAKSEIQRNREYALSMLATIKAIEGEYKESLQILDDLPETTNFTLNKVYILCKLFKKESNFNYLDRADRTLKKLQQESCLSDKFKSMLHQAWGMVYALKKENELSMSNFKRALCLAPSQVEKIRIMLDMTEVCLEQDLLEEAEGYLKVIESLLPEYSNKMTEASYNKLMGISLSKRKKTPDAAGYFIKAAKVLREKKLFTHLAELEFLCADLHISEYERGVEDMRYSENELTNGVEHYAKGLHAEQIAEEVKIEDAKIVNAIYCSCDHFDL